jgi:hypothetical protein
MLIIDITHQKVALDDVDGGINRYGASFALILMGLLTILMIFIYITNYGAKHFPRLWLNLCVTLPMYCITAIQLGYYKSAFFMFFFIPFNFVI